MSKGIAIDPAFEFLNETEGMIYRSPDCFPADHEADCQAHPDWKPVFYTLPVEMVEEGMSTADGQDFLEEPSGSDGWLWASVYTPSTDPDLDEAWRSEPEMRGYEVGSRINLAVFCNTSVDGSQHPQAKPGFDDSAE